MKIYKIEQYNNSEIKEKIYLRMQSFKSDLYKIDFDKLIVEDKLIDTNSIKELLKSGVIQDLMVVDGVELEIGKSYFVRYTSCESPWNKIKISRITVNGHPWQEGEGISGIIIDGQYAVEELTDETKLKNFAREYLKKIDFSIKTLPDIFVEMYNSYHI